MKNVSPADKVMPKDTRSLSTTRVPMNSAELKLTAQEIPGYYLYWMKGTPERIQQALSAGYTFVEMNETLTMNSILGSSSADSGNTDLGSRVSRLGGSEVGSDGQPIRLYLMKLPEEYHQEDIKAQDKRSMQLSETLNRDSANPYASGHDKGAYGRSLKTNMFQPKNGSL